MVLILAFFFLMILALLGTALITLVPTEMMAAGRDRTDTAAHYAALAGIQQASAWITAVQVSASGNSTSPAALGDTWSGYSTSWGNTTDTAHAFDPFSVPAGDPNYNNQYSLSQATTALTSVYPACTSLIPWTIGTDVIGLAQNKNLDAADWSGLGGGANWPMLVSSSPLTVGPCQVVTFILPDADTIWGSIKISSINTRRCYLITSIAFIQGVPIMRCRSVMQETTYASSSWTVDQNPGNQTFNIVANHPLCNGPFQSNTSPHFEVTNSNYWTTTNTAAVVNGTITFTPDNATVSAINNGTNWDFGLAWVGGNYQGSNQALVPFNLTNGAAQIVPSGPMSGQSYYNTIVTGGLPNIRAVSPVTLPSDLTGLTTDAFGSPSTTGLANYSLMYAAYDPKTSYNPQTGSYMGTYGGYNTVYGGFALYTALDPNQQAYCSASSTYTVPSYYTSSGTYVPGHTGTITTYGGLFVNVNSATGYAAGGIALSGNMQAVGLDIADQYGNLTGSTTMGNPVLRVQLNDSLGQDTNNQIPLPSAGDPAYYAAGYTGDIYLAGYTPYSAGYTGTTYSAGYTGDIYSAGYTTAYLAGYTGGYQAGYTGETYSAGYTGGYSAGYTGGYSAGYTGGYSSGYAGASAFTYSYAYGYSSIVFHPGVSVSNPYYTYSGYAMIPPPTCTGGSAGTYYSGSAGTHYDASAGTHYDASAGTHYSSSTATYYSGSAGTHYNSGGGVYYAGNPGTYYAGSVAGHYDAGSTPYGSDAGTHYNSGYTYTVSEYVYEPRPFQPVDWVVQTTYSPMYIPSSFYQTSATWVYGSGFTSATSSGNTYVASYTPFNTVNATTVVVHYTGGPASGYPIPAASNFTVDTSYAVVFKQDRTNANQVDVFVIPGSSTTNPPLNGAVVGTGNLDGLRGVNLGRQTIGTDLATNARISISDNVVQFGTTPGQAPLNAQNGLGIVSSEVVLRTQEQAFALGNTTLELYASVIAGSSMNDGGLDVSNPGIDGCNTTTSVSYMNGTHTSTLKIYKVSTANGNCLGNMTATNTYGYNNAPADGHGSPYNGLANPYYQIYGGLVERILDPTSYQGRGWAANNNFDAQLANYPPPFFPSTNTLAPTSFVQESLRI